MAEDEWTCENCGSEALGNFPARIAAAAGQMKRGLVSTVAGEKPGNFCSNCGAAKPEGKCGSARSAANMRQAVPAPIARQTASNGDMLTYYYARSVYQDLDIPYLTNFMRWRGRRGGNLGSGCFVRDPGSDEVGMFTDAGIVSDEPFPEKTDTKARKKRGESLTFRKTLVHAA